MRTAFAALLLLAAAARSAAAQSWADVWGAYGLSNAAYVSYAEAGTTFDKRRYALSARARTWRFPSGFSSTREEYSAALTRELYHVTLAGRLGTSAPSAQRDGYHLVGGEVRFTFYGADLGPEHPELSPVVWESSGPAPSPESLSREWVTRLRGSYLNIDNHLERQALPTLVVIENVWQLDGSVTWRERATLGAQFGFDRYNRVLNNNAPKIFQGTIDYPGNVVPLTGWPNNWLSLSAARRLGPVTLSAAGTRMNQLDNQLELMWSAGAAWETAGSLTVKAAYYRRHRRGGVEQDALSLGVSSRW